MYILLLLLIFSLIDCSSNYQNPIKVKSYVTCVISLVFPLKLSNWYLFVRFSLYYCYRNQERLKCNGVLIISKA